MSKPVSGNNQRWSGRIRVGRETSHPPAVTKLKVEQDVWEEASAGFGALAEGGHLNQTYRYARLASIKLKLSV